MRCYLWKIGNGGPKKVNILQVGRQFPLAASLMSGSGVFFAEFMHLEIGGASADATLAVNATMI